MADTARAPTMRTRWVVAVRESDLDQRAVLVALVLASWMDAGGACWPSLAAIAHGARFSPSTVKLALIDLERGGWIVRDHGGGRGKTTRYTAAMPPGKLADLAGQYGTGNWPAGRRNWPAGGVETGRPSRLRSIQEVTNEGATRDRTGEPPPDVEGFAAAAAANPPSWRRPKAKGAADG